MVIELSSKKNTSSKKVEKKKKKIRFSEQDKLKFRKRFNFIFIVWICILAIGLVRKSLQNDTFYTIEIGKLILNNGIDMMDHFSFHAGLAYTYPHWLYDVFIYLVYKVGGMTGLYVSSIVLLMILLVLVFFTNKKITKSSIAAGFATFICAIAISGFATARAQLASFILFILEIYFIESFLEKKKKRYIVGLLLISLLLCNIHVAVWPFYFILYLPYLVEYIVSVICNKIKLKKDNKFINFIKKRVVLERNKNIKYLFLVMIFSVATGLLTPIGDTPYTYLIKTMMGNSQDYIQEHQMITWISSPFTIIIACETIFLAILSKVKLRDLFMICGLVLMSIMSIRHLSLLALIGTLCFARVFKSFLDFYKFDVDLIFMRLFKKKIIVFGCFLFGVILSAGLFYYQSTKDYVDKELYPVEAVKYIKENLNVEEIRIFNDYNFGSYLLYNDIPVYIDSRADLYTKQFSGFQYDIFDDYEYILTNYRVKFEFYDISHVLIYKEKNKFYEKLLKDDNYEIIYEDDYFVLFKKLGTPNIFLDINKN